MLKRILLAAAAAGAALAAAGVIMVAISYAIFALAKPYVGQAGAAGVVALVYAILLGVGFAVAASGAKGKAPKVHKRGGHHEEPGSLMSRVMDTARERPLVAAAGAVAAGLLAIRNPTLVATALGLINQPPRPRR